MEPKKRSLGAAERDEFLRAAWRALVAGEVAAGRFVFVDECGSNTAMAAPYAWSRRGERAFGLAPRNRGSNVTLLVSMGSGGWALAWPWRGRRPRRSLRCTWRRRWPRRCGGGRWR
ncbi:MAG: transposase [Actinomycetota bacterium]|nr:transposase [Actinomycetota bacterium]